jgi:hypothetical protein
MFFFNKCKLLQCIGQAKCQYFFLSIMVFISIFSPTNQTITKMRTFIYLAAIVLLLGMFACGTPQQPTESQTEMFVLNDSITEVYTLQARDIVQATFKALSSSLMQAMSYGGVPYALEFCNVEALPITDSVAAHFSAEISRLALKNRNPENYPAGRDEEILEWFQLQFENGTPLSDTIILYNDDHLVYFAPIMLAEQCLACHGTPGNELSLDNHNYIKQFYPADKAVGFASGDLRGMWRIGFNFASN